MKTYVWLIVDKSGSMNSVRSDVIGGINAYTHDRLDEPDTLLTLTLFDTHVTALYTNQTPQDVIPMTERNYAPSGSTALLDAVGTTVAVGEKTVGIDDRVLIVIFTDGQENASREYTAATIKSMIQERSARGNYTFVFMGADQDAWAVGESYGIYEKNRGSFDKSHAAAAMGRLSANTKAYARKTEMSSDDWLAETPDDQAGPKPNA